MTLSRSEELLSSCWDCRRCIGAAYQIPPVLYCGNFEAPILVVAQNPGEIDPARHHTRAKAIDRFSKIIPEASEILRFYNWDFGTSYGAKRLGSVFGENWITSGRFCYTNAVRCRTKNNEYPSNQMRENCKSWTETLLENRKLIVTVGALARESLLGDEIEDLGYGSYRYVQGRWYVLAIKHYSAWRARGEALSYKHVFTQVARLAMGHR